MQFCLFMMLILLPRKFPERIRSWCAVLRVSTTVDTDLRRNLVDCGLVDCGRVEASPKQHFAPVFLVYLISMHVRYFCARYWKTTLECDARCGGLAGCRYRQELNSCSYFFSLTASIILLEAWGKISCRVERGRKGKDAGGRGFYHSDVPAAG